MCSSMFRRTDPIDSLQMKGGHYKNNSFMILVPLRTDDDELIVDTLEHIINTN